MIAVLIVTGLGPTARADSCGAVSLGCSSDPEPSGSASNEQPSSGPPAEQSAPPAETTIDVGAGQQLLDLLNRERVARGLRRLQMREDIVAVAAEHSRKMADSSTLYHNDAYFSRASKDALDAKVVGENVAASSTVERMHEALMNSAPHQANILDPRWEVIGIAVARTSQGRLWATQDFVQPNPPPPSATPAPAKVTAAGAPRVTPKAQEQPAQPAANDEAAIVAAEASSSAPPEARLMRADPALSRGAVTEASALTPMSTLLVLTALSVLVAAGLATVRINRRLELSGSLA